MLPALLVIVLAIGFLTLVMYSWRREHLRRERLASLANRLGLHFSAERRDDLAAEFRSFRDLGTGENRYAFCVLEGTLLSHSLTAFDFHYETESTGSKGQRQTARHHLHVAAIRLERPLPGLFLAPEGLFSKVAQAFGYDDIDFESHEFSKLFCVRSADRRFAYDFCNASMIDLLLGHPRLQLETRDGWLALVFSGTMDPDGIETEIALLCSIRDHLPDYLFATT